MVNYDQIDGAPFDDWTNGSVTFAIPRPLTRGPKEAWTLTCEDRGGRLRDIRDLVVDRDDRVNVGRVCSRAASALCGSASVFARFCPLSPNFTPPGVSWGRTRH